MDAASNALRNILDQLIGPSLRLKEYGLKAITGGTDALANASICFEDEIGNQFRGEAIDEDVILASVMAMVKGANRAMNYRKHFAQGAQSAERDEPGPRLPASRAGNG